MDYLVGPYYLRGYQYGAGSVRSLAGIVDERTTRFALGKGRVKEVVKLFVTRMALRAYISDYDKGYIDAILDSVGC